MQARYRVREELGRGGMATVLAAYDVVLEREVALKIMLPQLVASSEAVTRFVNEARSLARIESPHVVRVLDCGKLVAPAPCAGLPFMVLELLRGEDLYSVAAREGGLSPARVVRYALEACAGLSAAHAQGNIHRDLKPENLFVALDADGRECLKVLDFGIARSRSRRAVTRGRGGLGSPGYMSPEQVQGAAHVDVRSDVWGLGVTLYELLVQRSPFVGTSAQAILNRILQHDPARISRLRDDVPADLEAIVGDEMRVESADGGFSLEELHFAGATNETPHARVVIVDAEGTRHEAEADGDGPVDALMKAIDAAAGSSGTLLEYSVSAVTSGKDALGEARVVCEIDGRRFAGQSVSTDVLEASAIAYVRAVNASRHAEHGERVAGGV